MTKPIFNQRHEEVAGIRIIKARAVADASIQINFRNLFKAGHKLWVVGLLKQAISLHAPRFCFWNHVSKDVKISQFRRADILND